MSFREIAVINWPTESSFVFRHISACANPVRTQRWQALRDMAMKIGITPRAARVVHAHWFVLENYGEAPALPSIWPLIDFVGASEISRNGTRISVCNLPAT